jgi:hypothetical protein
LAIVMPQPHNQETLYRDRDLIMPMTMGGHAH